MKCLTFIQPWASLIVDGRKLIETRSWPTKYRGTIGIHAGMTPDKAACVRFGYEPATIPRGVVLCTAVVIDCVRFPSPLARPDPYGDFTAGRYGWILGKVMPLTYPLHVKGALGLWNCDALDAIHKPKLGQG